MAKLTRRSWLLLGIASGLSSISSSVSAATKFLSGSIKVVGSAKGKRQTRVLLSANSSIKYRYFTLAHPNRLVIDVEGVPKNSALESLNKKIPSNDIFIERIRLGQKDSNTVRLVFDLKRPAKANVIHKNKQLQIDFIESDTLLTSSSSPNSTMATINDNDDPLGKLLTQRENTRSEATIYTRKRRPVIVLDAGHGGKDPGAIGPRGTYEKTVALAFAHEVRKLLQQKGYTVHMTRTDDTFIPLADRRRKARSVKADLFISIHANASENKAAQGSDVFIWGAKANSERALKLSQAENQADYVVDGMPNVGNKNVDMILTDLMRTQTENDSTRLGNQILKRFSQHNKLFQNQVGKADFVVLRSLDIPSVLIELAFISNPEEEKLLTNQSFRRKMSIAIADSVENYLKNTILIQ